jgi:replicative DNA helicase
MDPYAVRSTYLPRELEQGLLNRTFYTYGAELHEAGNLSPEDFTEPHLAELWAGIKETFTNPKTWSYCDLLNLKLSARARQILLRDLSLEENGKTSYWAREIRANAQLKHALTLSELSASMTKENKEQRLEEIKKIQTLLERPADLEKVEPIQLAVDFVNELQYAPEFIETNSPALNDLIDGFHPGRLYLLAARTSVGKTAVALNLAWGLKGRAKVGFYSLEMTSREILGRLASLETGWLHSRIKQKADQETNEVLARNFIPAFEKSGFEIITNPQGFTMAELRSHALELRQQGKLEVLVIDQLDKIRAAGKLSTASEYEILTKHSTQLKQLALELNVPLILLCQINREGNEEPSLKHLKGSGQLEQDADLVFLLHRTQPATEREVELSFNVAKNRHGSTGKVFYRFQGDLMRLVEPKSNYYTKPSFNPADSVRKNTWTTAGTAF